MPTTDPDDAFGASRACFEQMCSFMGGDEAAGLTHAELEETVTVDAREAVRLLLQDHVDLRAVREERLDDVADAAGVRRGSVETGHVRPLRTVVGKIDITRLAYRCRGELNLYPADAALSLPDEVHSHGLRRLCAIESARGSYEEAAKAIHRCAGQQLGKRQMEQLAARAAVDFEAFYTDPSRLPAPVADSDCE